MGKWKKTIIKESKEASLKKEEERKLCVSKKVVGTLSFQHNVVPMLDWWIAKAKEQKLKKEVIDNVITNTLQKKTHMEVYNYLRRQTIEV